MKIYILYSYGYEDQTNIKAFMKLSSAESLLNKCSDYELKNPCPSWGEWALESFEDFEKRDSNWVNKHPAKQTESAGIGFRIEEISLIK
tara:strand:+ start:367 stop:633 length:267 start_codon:yes stop_codon:yes gene_type:complete